MRITVILGAMAIIGCTTAVPSFVEDGSRADARVTMVSEVVPVGATVDWTTALRDAEIACREWGFSGGRPLGGERERWEIESTIVGPIRSRRYERIYQCTD